MPFLGMIVTKPGSQVTHHTLLLPSGNGGTEWNDDNGICMLPTNIYGVCSI